MKELRELADFVEHFSINNVDSKIVETAKYCILDTVGVAMGAGNNKMFRRIRKMYEHYEGKSDKAMCSVWGSETPAPLHLSVFFNAMLGHTLELDDVHTSSKTHIGTVVVPAAWGLAEYLNKNGQQLIEAVICGYEVMARIGTGFGVSGHRNKGWHVTGTAGVFGSAAACAKLLNFNTDQILAAFGLAGTQSCSTWAFLSDGANNKVLHPARAAVSGLEACILVQGGMCGSSHILDAEDGGIYPMMSDEFDYSQVNKNLWKQYEILNVDKKPYPCCRSIHCAIDAAISLREKYQIDPQNISLVTVKTYLVGWKQCGRTDSSVRPTMPTEAKFSTPYAVACALSSGTVGLSDFETEAIGRTEIRSLMELVQVKESEYFTARYPEHWGCEMEITMADNNSYTIEIPDASGGVDVPLSESQILSKVKSCCSFYDISWVEGTIAEILALENFSKLPLLTY